MFGKYFYNKNIRNIVVLFGTVFNDINVRRVDSEGVVKQNFKIPIAYGPAQKYLVRAEQNNIDNTIHVGISLPRMSFEIITMTYDSTRKLQTTKKIKALKTLGTLSKIEITNGGTGYTVDPIIEIEAPPAGGTQATAIITLVDTENNIKSGLQNGVVKNITLTNNGSGYTSVPNVTIKTATTDVGGTAKTITATGDTQHSTTQSKIGASSIYFDGSGNFRGGVTGDILTLAHDTAWNFPDGAATIEWWMKSPLANAYNGAGGKGLFGHNPSGADPVTGWEFYMNASGKLQFLGSNDGTQSNLTSTTTIGDDAWHHIALTWDGSTTKIWIDGTVEDTHSDTSPFGSQTTLLRIGTAYSNIGNVNGYYDEIRISNIARYTTTFTPSTTAFTTDNNTKLLIHSDTTNASTTFTDEPANSSIFPATATANINVDNNKLITAYTPVPYNFEIDLSIMVLNSDDGAQILEQILPYFTPEFQVTMNEMSTLGIKRDIPIVLNSISTEDDYEGDFISRRNLVHTLSFTVQGYLYGPTSEQGVIREIDVNAGTDFDDVDVKLININVKPNPTTAVPDDNSSTTTTITDL